MPGKPRRRPAERPTRRVRISPRNSRYRPPRRTLRTRIVSELGEERSDEKLAETAQSVWEDMKPLAEMIRDALAGPPARVSGRVRDRHKIDDSTEARKRARAEMGL